MMTKKGVSPIIATILLILISIVAVATIVAFVVPFVKNYLDDSKECFNIPEQISIKDSSKYTCFNNVDNKIGVGVIRSSEDVEIGGFKISIQGTDAAGDLQSVVFEIKDGESTTDVSMLTTPGVLSVPGKGEERTYVVSLGGSLIKTPERILVAPISAKGKQCSVADEVELRICLESVILGATYLGSGCVPDCDGKECGDNGCEGSCGICSVGTCTASGLCVGSGS